MTSTKNQARRLVAVGAFAVAAVAAPLTASMLTADASESVALPPGCLAWFGNAEDGHCLGYSNGMPLVGGTPEIGIGNSNGSSGATVNTGPLMPGATINQGIG